MLKIKLLATTLLVGVVAALTYFVFEFAVHHSIDFVWNDLFNSDQTRWLVFPLAVVLGAIFFGVRHWLDPASEKFAEHGLGGSKLDLRLSNLGMVLAIGFFSLLAGASLGPEAILVPACMIAGGLIGQKALGKKNSKFVAAMSAAGLIALFAAFFHSFIVGVLAIFLVKKESKTEITRELVVLAVLASGASALTLNIIDPTGTYFNLPDVTLKVAIIDLLAGIALIAAGYAAVFALKFIHAGYIKHWSKYGSKNWAVKSLVAGLGLGLMYFAGGDLVQFTGNESIKPMYEQSAQLGILGLLWTAVFKIFAIAWSIAMGYRGGMIFPMIFVASTLAAISQLVFMEANFSLGIIFAFMGVLMAEKKAKILF